MPAAQSLPSSAALAHTPLVVVRWILRLHLVVVFALYYFICSWLVLLVGWLVGLVVFICTHLCLLYITYLLLYCVYLLYLWQPLLLLLPTDHYFYFILILHY